jgi:superfamily II DNA or RNA helicase
VSLLKFGLYEQVINEAVREELEKLSRDDVRFDSVAIDDAEASYVLSSYFTAYLRTVLDAVAETRGRGIKEQVELVNRIVTHINGELKSLGTDVGGKPAGGAIHLYPSGPELLAAVINRRNSVFALNENEHIIRPETSLSSTSLFTGSEQEPAMYSELKKEIVSCDRIDMLVSFIKWSGLRLIIDELRAFCLRGGRLRIITTSYMGATDPKAVDTLVALPNTDVKISFDTRRTRLHAKAYLFYRDTGFDTAYVGSSNLSNAAMTSGLEWNIKVTAKDLPETFEKVSGTFESYWNAKEFVSYSATPEDKSKLVAAIEAERSFGETPDVLPVFDLRPYPYQSAILENLEVEREVRGRFKNLVVAATGTGKTVIAAFDYRNYVRKNAHRPCRLLFIAHREEILDQSLHTFRAVLRDANFGDKMTGTHRPGSVESLFMTIQSFNSSDFANKTSEDFFDYIVVDEFHHAAAPSYQELLSYYRPRILLGLTATPERMDGKSILDFFDGRIAAEIRLPEAIDMKLLAPFQYFGVTDTVDLDTLKWTRGGYDRQELSNVYTLSGHVADRRAELVVESVLKYVTDIRQTKGLGFCVSVEHAEYMARFFNRHGIPSIALTGQSDAAIRKDAKGQLVRGDIRFIFTVDLYNEGIDIPEINTVLFLRPTESLTVFLQQLGRGLRLADDKECLTVLDFIGQANRRYRFEDRFTALLAKTGRSIQREIKSGFMSLPKGCYIQLERKAQEYILENIRSSLGLKATLVNRLASFTEDTGKEPTLANFLDYYRLEPEELYARGSFSRLSVLAGIRDDFREETEDVLTNAFGRISRVDSVRWIRFLLKLLKDSDGFSYNMLSADEKRMLTMFQFTVWQKSVEECGFADPLGGIRAIAAAPVMCAELMALLDYIFDRIDVLNEPVEFGFSCPLDLHCTYSRDQILTALDFMKPTTVREGVKWLEPKKTDVFFITLNKSEKDYSPTTNYQDYVISDTLFHWQSQSTTSEHSPTGQRYIHHRERGSSILLFVRDVKARNNTAEPYTFLGLADYVSHKGSNPMNIVWRLRKPIHPKFMKTTRKLVSGY